jgi:hypothetical protein
MTTAATVDWQVANQRYLVLAFDRVRAALERHAAPDGPGTAERVSAAWTGLDEAAAMPTPPVLETLCTLFGLSPFERDLLVLCAGMELDANFAACCAAAQGDPARAYPTFGLALASLPDPHWSALSPAGPLRSWRLVEIGAGSALTLSPLRIDERILHHLAGVQHLDERLAGLVEPLRPLDDLVPSQQAVADHIAAIWTATGSTTQPVVQLCGPERSGRRAIAASACAALGLDLHALSIYVLPAHSAELTALARLWSRETALSRRALLLDCDDVEPTDAARESAVARLVAATRGPLLVAGRERRRLSDRPLVSFDVGRPAAAEQRALWRAALGQAATRLNGQTDALVAQFDLSGGAIRAACAQALTDPEDAGVALWDACRAQARTPLDDLAQRIEPAATWDDLVLPEAPRQTLREIAAHVRQRAQVYERWGFAAKSSRGLGISALLVGPSGTGKTLATEVLADELRLDLYRIDLAAVVSKYIGETEKNLRRVFEAAEESGAILLFDEADALFGKRSEVKDSRDRYANIEVSYLLQRMEAYRGLAILTTNMKSALDSAFLRRIRFVVQFPFPDAPQRAVIWQRIFPAATPTAGLDVGKLARLNVAGGNIRNIALNAAFLAADEGAAVGMAHVLRAARSEYAKLEKPLTESEIRAWT